ncbi:MAG: sulfur carrier protein ThiS [Candidatus Methylomirabilales bacterium]
MQIQLNGKDRDVSDGITIAQLLVELDVRPERVAVLVNQGIVKKPSYTSTMLREGDMVEVLTVMAGGMGRYDDGV